MMKAASIHLDLFTRNGMMLNVICVDHRDILMESIHDQNHFIQFVLIVKEDTKWNLFIKINVQFVDDNNSKHKCWNLPFVIVVTSLNYVHEECDLKRNLEMA